MRSAYASFPIAVVGLLFGAVSYYLYHVQLIYTSNNIYVSLLLSVLFMAGFGLALTFTIRASLSIRELESAASRFSRAPSLDTLEAIKDGLPTHETRTLVTQLTHILRQQKTATLEEIKHIVPLQESMTPIALQFLAGSSLLIGLLGTYLGIIQSVKAYDAIISSSPDAANYLSRLLAGLDKAFGATIAGIIASVLLGSLAIHSRLTSRKLIRAMQAFTLTDVFPHFNRADADFIGQFIEASINRLLPSVVRQAAQQLVESTEAIRAGARVFASSGEHFTSAADKLAKSADINSNVTGELGTLLNGFDLTLTELVSLDRQLKAGLSAALKSQDESLHEIGSVSKKFAELVVQIDSLTSRHDAHVEAWRARTESESNLLASTARSASEAIEKSAVKAGVNLTKIAESQPIIIDSLKTMAVRLQPLATLPRLMDYISSEMANIRRDIQEYGAPSHNLSASSGAGVSAPSAIKSRGFIRRFFGR